MTNLEAIKLILTVVSGVCWTVVYIEGIRVGFKDKSYAIPFYALALNNKVVEHDAWSFNWREGRHRTRQLPPA